MIKDSGNTLPPYPVKITIYQDVEAVCSRPPLVL